MTTREFDAVLFDLDSTLVDERYVAIASMAACRELANEHRGLDPLALGQANGETWLRYWAEIEQPWILGRLSTDDLRHEVWRRTLERFDITDEASITQAIETHHRHELAEYLTFPDALPTIHALRDAGVKIGVVTNGATDTQREKLDLLGITPLADAIIVSAEVGAAKPSPEIFESALAALRVERNRVAHVGDSLHADIGGALAAGITAIWLNRRHAERAKGDPVPSREIDSLASLVE
jgi:putative hydrolase of the HAD superfamily